MVAKRIKAGSANKNTATTSPVKAVSELVNFWDRDFAQETGYRGLTVEVVGRADNVLSFYVLDSAGKAKRAKAGAPFTVNLDDGMEVWSDLPSTAQSVDPESSQRIGYLFLAPAWFARNKTIAMEGPKWPRGYSI